MARVSAPSILNSESGLARYLQETRRFPLLTPQEEIEFATRWRKYGDRNAGDLLVTSHLRLVVSIAAGCERLAGPAFRWRQRSHEGPVSGTRALS
jgi:RNA polymerase sigma-32 factor